MDRNSNSYIAPCYKQLQQKIHIKNLAFFLSINHKCLVNVPTQNQVNKQDIYKFSNFSKTLTFLAVLEY